MNWDAIGAIAELLGAIGVIASLVYLATQIRESREQMSQNTRAMRAGAYQQLHEHMAESFESVPGPETLLIRRGNADLHQLSEEDRHRYAMWANRLMISLEDAHYQYRIGMLDEDRWRLYRSALRSNLGFPGFSQWWTEASPGLGNMLSPEFVALVEQSLAEAQGSPDRAR